MDNAPKLKMVGAKMVGGNVIELPQPTAPVGSLFVGVVVKRPDDAPDRASAPRRLFNFNDEPRST